MRVKLIIFKKPNKGNVLVSFENGEDINGGDWFYREGVGIKMCESVVGDILHTSTGTNPKVDCKKLIASDNPNHKLPRIDYGGLEERFGIVDTKMQEMLFVDGQKIFSRQDIIDAIKFGADIELKRESVDYKIYGSASNQFIESLKTPRMFYVDVEMQGDSVKISKLKEYTR